MVELKLHMLMAKNRVTQKELSEATGIRQATISAYYNDTSKHIVKDHIDILCKYFDVDVNELIEYKKD